MSALDILLSVVTDAEEVEASDGDSDEESSSVNEGNLSESNSGSDDSSSDSESSSSEEMSSMNDEQMFALDKGIEALLTSLKVSRSTLWQFVRLSSYLSSGGLAFSY